MHPFQDDTGQTWELSLTVGALRRVKGFLPDVDLLRIDEEPTCSTCQGTSPPDVPCEACGGAGKGPPLLATLSGNPVLVCEILCCVIKPQLDALGIAPDQFYDRMAGPGLRAGLAAFWQELDDFFQQLGRSDLSQLAKVPCKLLAELVSLNRSAIEAWETERQQNRHRTPTNAATDGSSSTGSPASSESIPTP